MASVHDIFRRATTLHECGDLKQAADLYRQILKLYPKNADTLHLYGLLLHQQGDHKAAIKQMSKSIKIQAKNPICLNNLGIAYKALGKYTKQNLHLKEQFIMIFNFNILIIFYPLYLLNKFLLLLMFVFRNLL